MNLGIYKDMSDKDYHEIKGKNHFYSSSQLKEMLNDPEKFKGLYITRSIESTSIPAFDIGTYFHTAILEPHKLDEACAVYQGAMRRGKEWDKFKEKHEGKAIITAKELVKAQNLILAVQDSEAAQTVLDGGEAEVSLFVKLNGVNIKVRADYLVLGPEGFITDLKSTTGNTKDAYSIRNKTSSYSYDLSAALYMDAFNAYFEQEGLDDRIKNFHWVYASKDYPNCKTYTATEKMIAVGRAKYKYALEQIKKYTKLDWVIPDEIAMLDPVPWEEEWITKDAKEVKSKRYNNREQATATGAEFL